jgi:hypothetical protein
VLNILRGNEVSYSIAIIQYNPYDLFGVIVQLGEDVTLLRYAIEATRGHVEEVVDWSSDKWEKAVLVY